MLNVIQTEIRVVQPDFPAFGTEQLVNPAYPISGMGLLKTRSFGLNLNKTSRWNAEESRLKKKFPEHQVQETFHK